MVDTLGNVEHYKPLGTYYQTITYIEKKEEKCKRNQALLSLEMLFYTQKGREALFYF